MGHGPGSGGGSNDLWVTGAILSLRVVSGDQTVRSMLAGTGVNPREGNSPTPVWCFHVSLATTCTSVNPRLGLKRDPSCATKSPRHHGTLVTLLPVINCQTLFSPDFATEQHARLSKPAASPTACGCLYVGLVPPPPQRRHHFSKHLTANQGSVHPCVCGW
jgi:hypothetical protein